MMSIFGKFSARYFLLVVAFLLSILSSSKLYAAEGNPRVNQVGYLPQATKIAVYKATSEKPLRWKLMQGKKKIAKGKTRSIGLDQASGDIVHHIDFSSVKNSGSDFYLKVGKDKSYPFDISQNIYSPILYDSIRYFYHNRSGIPIETQYTGGGRGSYAADEQWARPAGHIGEGKNKGDFKVPCWPKSGCEYTLDVTKGWYDAGDHGKYVVNGGISVWKLLNMYEYALYMSKREDLFEDGSLNIPESKNNVPDILDEVRWQMEFMLAMQVPEGEKLAGMAHHKIHDMVWTGLPLAPHEDSQQRALVPPTTAATLNLAANAAQCARLYKKYDQAFAERCLKVATKAWQAANKHPDMFYGEDYNTGGGPYGDNNAKDEFYWAAVELFITTGDKSYLSHINAHKLTAEDFAWGTLEIPGLISLVTVPAAHTAKLVDAAKQRIIEVADIQLAKVQASAYPVPSSFDEYYWGSNNVVANKMFTLGLAYDFTGEDIYFEAFSKSMDYLFGNNALSFSYISGHGENALKAPHHRFWAAPLDKKFPITPPGAFSGGPNIGLQDGLAAKTLADCKPTPAKCFMDHIDSWSTNEITINWNSALAWVLAYYDSHAHKSSNAKTAKR